MKDVVNKSFMLKQKLQESGDRPEIFQLVLTFDEFKDACWQALELGRYAPKLQCSDIRAAKNGVGRWFMMNIEGELFSFPASKKLAAGTELTELQFGLTFPTEANPDTTFIAFKAGGEMKLL
jgi:hypothetical protein